MSNNTYAYNIQSPVAIVGSHVQGHPQAIDSIRIVEAPHRVPLPWLLSFRASDLRPVEVHYRTGPTAWASRKALAPVVSVNDALHTFLSRAREIVELVGDEATAKGFIQLFTDGLSSLMWPYIALDAFEVVDLNDPAEPSRAMLIACGASVQAKKQRLSLSGYTPGVKPYASDAIYTQPPSALPDKVKLENAVALDPLFLPLAQRVRETTGVPTKPAPRR
jgi:hypothetical protein